MNVRAKALEHRVPVIVNLYRNGFSYAKIRARMGISVSFIRKTLKRMGELKPKVVLPCIVWNGRKYAEGRDGYWRATVSPRTMLHRDVFAFHMGRPVREGFDVNHKDHCKWNNDFNNLQEMPKPEHGRETNRWLRNNGSQLPGVEFDDEVPF